jgi:NADH:ubiquinone oxidoreductase subunit E
MSEETRSAALEQHPVEVVVCLGSSCYARGNTDNLAILKKYAESHRVDIRLTGSLCQDHCKQGPNLMIAGQLHHGVTAARLRELLQQLAQRGREDHGTA